MLEMHLRPSFQRVFVDPVAKYLQKSRVTATHLTLLAGGLGLFVPIFSLFALPLLAVGVMWLSGYFDVLDGTLARMKNHSSDAGAVLDIVMDRWVEVCCIFALYFVSPTTRGALCLTMLSSILLCVTSFLVVGMFVDNQSQKSFHYSPGLIERAEAFIFFTAMLLLPHLFAWFALLFSALVIYTTVLRIWQFYRSL
jgi:archaetidylinositol phosphate synthase